MSSNPRVTLIGAGTIGLSFAAVHLNSHHLIKIYDPDPNLASRIKELLPAYLTSSATRSLATNKSIVESSIEKGSIILSSSLQEAVEGAHIIQEQGPENVAWKQDTWALIEKFAPAACLFWSSTSGITTTLQSTKMIDKSRLIVVHPFNPPHIMPLIEIVPSPLTNHTVVSKTVKFWKELGRKPVVVKKEVTGFVANRIAFALLRESVHLVNEGVIGVEDLDTVVTSSMGPRWAVLGPFKSYHIGGGADGFMGFINNIGGTVQDCWDDAGKPNVSNGLEEVYRQTEAVYGVVPKDDFERRNKITKEVLGVTMRRRRNSS